MKLELELYTPGEAEQVTKVAQTTVRNWRRAGYLARQEGQARYTVADLLFQTSMQTLGARGITPESAKGFASHVAAAIFQSMMFSHKTYSAGVNAAALDEVGEVSADRFARLQEVVGPQFSMDDLRQLDARTAMLKAAEKSFGTSGLKAPTWLIIWANDEIQFYYDEDISEQTFFGNTVYDDYVKGPVILLCLGALAQMVLDRLPRPAIKLVGEGRS